MRVMTYNIKTGATGRREVVAAVVADAAPDILALQELRGDAGPWLARRLGMRMVLARSWWGQPVAVLVHPRWEVRDRGVIARPFHHAAARAEIATSAGPLRLVAAHLAPHWGWRRLHEARWLVSATRGARLALVMGDLNTLDPWTDHTDRLRRLPAVHRVRHLRRRPFGAERGPRDTGPFGRVDTRAVAALDAAGLVDLFRAVGEGPGETAPTALGGPEFSGMRLDYLFATGALAGYARDCRVLRTPDADRASDHYPVVADLDIAH